MKNTPNNTVYISNLSYKRDRNGIRSLLAEFGKIKNIKIVVEPETNQSRGMAFVEMSSLKEAKEIIETLDGMQVDGRTIKVNYAIPQPGAKPSGFVNTTNAKASTKQKDLDYKAIQLAKKKRNDERRQIKAGFIFKTSKK